MGRGQIKRKAATSDSASTAAADTTTTTAVAATTTTRASRKAKTITMTVPFSLQLPAAGDDLISIPLLKVAGIGKVDDARLFYRRNGVQTLLDFAEDQIARAGLGFVDGLPGTGKSSVLWYKMLCLAYFEGKKIAWFHMDRAGYCTQHVELYEKSYRVLEELRPKDIDTAIENTVADVLVLDGVNVKNFQDLHATLRFCTNRESDRTGFLTMSAKVERLHQHELDALSERRRICYYTQHSWTFDEYRCAFISGDGSQSLLFKQNIAIFQEEWEIEEGNVTRAARKRNQSGASKLASAEEIIANKFFVCGGSARWMLSNTSTETEQKIRSHISAAIKVDDILNFNLGPTSGLAKTHLYFSKAIEGDSMNVEYTIVSERATQILVESMGENGIKALYGHATKINNPAFLGWIVKADFFNRCGSNTLRLRKKGDQSAKAIICERTPVVFDHAHLKYLSSLDDSSDLAEALMKLLPPVQGDTTMCKPYSWNQGGYDVVRIVKVGPSSYNLMFGQVTKSETNSLKMKFFAEFVAFFANASLVVSAVEIGMIVPSGGADAFRMTQAQVTGSGLLSHAVVLGSSSNKWASSKEASLYVVYELDMVGMNYPTCTNRYS
jgi:hypothetical protein